jgi:hypothetical protein
MFTWDSYNGWRNLRSKHVKINTVARSRATLDYFCEHIVVGVNEDEDQGSCSQASTSAKTGHKRGKNTATLIRGALKGSGTSNVTRSACAHAFSWRHDWDILTFRVVLRRFIICMSCYFIHSVCTRVCAVNCCIPPEQVMVTRPSF